MSREAKYIFFSICICEFIVCISLGITIAYWEFYDQFNIITVTPLSKYPPQPARPKTNPYISYQYHVQQNRLHVLRPS